MKKIISFILILCSLSNYLIAQVPTWTKLEFRNNEYPSSKYLLGYSTYKNQQKETEEVFIEKLKGYAQKELIQSVRTTIESASVIKTLESNDEFSQLFMMSSISTSGMSISGLKLESYYDKKTKVGYAFAYANREKVIAFYKGKLQVSKSNVEQKLALTKKLNNEQTKQLKHLNSCFTDFRTVEEAQSILFALNPTVSESELLIADFKNLKTEIESLKSKLEKSVADNITEAASMLVFVLKDQLESNDIKVRLLNLSYQDTRMGSSFSRRFSKTLEQKLVSEAGIEVVADVQTQSADEINNLLNGTYWEEGNSLRIILVLKNTKENKTLASAEVKLDINWLNNNNISYKPENFLQAYSNMKAFKTNELTGGGLLAEIWTNKGDENLIYSEGDLLKLFVRINRECFIRVIYHLADGSKVQLVDNYYIDAGKVNTVYELPFEFECAEPFGVETLQLNAQTKAFDPLNIENIDGYEFIKDGLNEILVNTRGFKKVTSNVQKTEKRVIITTMRE